MHRWWVALGMALACSGAAAQPYPSRPVRIVVPATTGGAIDLIARSLAEKMSAPLGQPVIVENKPGAANNLGTDFVAKSPPDGYTLLMATSSTHSIGPYLGKVPYDPQKDFAPIVYVGKATNILVVSPALGVRSVRELIELAKRNPGKLNYASSGIGGISHLTSEMFASMAGIKLTHVPYKGTQLSIPDLMSTQITLLFDSVLTAKPHIDSKKLVGLSVSSRERSALVPDMPTVSESGLPGFDSWTWFGIFAPAGTPQAVLDRVNAEMNRIISDAAMKERFAQLGFETTGGTPAAFAAVVQSEARKWSQVIREAQVKPE